MGREGRVDSVHAPNIYHRILEPRTSERTIKPVLQRPLNASRRFSAQAFWGFAGWLFPLIVVFLLAPRLLHLLGPSRFGVLMIVLITPIIASQIDFGIGSSAVRRFAADLKQGPLDASAVLFSYLVTFCAIALLFGATVMFVSPWLAETLGFSALLGSEAATELVKWCALWGAVTLATGLPALVARAMQAFAWLTAMQTLSTIVLWAGALGLVAAGHPLRDIVTLGLAVSIASASLVILPARRAVRLHGPLSFRPSIPADDMRFATGMFATQLASTIAFQTDRILISSFGSPAIAGTYSLCVTLANKPLAAIAAITSFAYPHASGLHSLGERAALSALLQALDRAVAVLVVPLLVPGVWLAPVFLALWLGAYSTPEVTLAFQLLLLAYAITTFAVPASHVLAASGRSGPAAAFSWLTAVVVTTGIILLVPRYGLTGAVIAILAGMSTSPIFHIVARRALALQTPEKRLQFWSGVLTGVLAQAVLLFLFADQVVGWWTLMLVGITSWAAFFLMRAIGRMLTPEELQLLTRIGPRSFRR